MTDKTDLIELTDSEEQMVSIIWQAFPEYFDGAVEGQNYGDSEKLTRLARELSEHFIEQACAIGDDQKDRTGFIIYGTQQEAFNQGIEAIQRAIRDKFEGERK